MATFGAGTSAFGALTGWALNQRTPDTSSKRETAHGPDNNEIASNLFDKRTDHNETFRAVDRAAAPVIPTLIGLLNDLALTSINVSTTKEDFATMALVGHAHVDGTDDGTGEATALRSVEHGMELTKAFGFNAFGFTVADGISSSLTIECEHAEVPDADGDTAAGENHNPTMTLVITSYTGGVAAEAGWEETNSRLGTDAQGFQTVEQTFVKPLAFAAV